MFFANSFCVAVVTTSLWLGTALAHRPHLDNGTHTSITTAWTFPDTTITRIWLLTFDCPSEAVYGKVTITDPSVPLTVGMGIPNETALFDYRPSLWAVGKTVVVPDSYKTERAASSSSGLAESVQPHIPYNFNAVEFPSEGNNIFKGHGENGEVIRYDLLLVNITVSAPGDVYLVLQPQENRRARAYITVGTDENHDAEPGSASEVDVNAWYSSTSWPRMGWTCERW